MCFLCEILKFAENTKLYRDQILWGYEDKSNVLAAATHTVSILARPT